MIDMIFALAIECLKAVKIVVKLKSTTSAVKNKCEDLAGSVKTLQAILRSRYSPAAAKDEGMVDALSGLKAALDHAHGVVKSCDRHIQRGLVGLLFFAIRGREDLAKLVAADERIDRCIKYFKLAAPASRVQTDVVDVNRPVVVRREQPLPPVIHNHYNIRVDRVDNVYCAVHQGGGAAMASSGSSGTQMQQLAMASSRHPALVGVPSQQQRRPTEMTTAAAMTTTYAASAAVSPASASRSRRDDHRGAPGPATTTSNAAAALASSSRPTDHREAPSATRRQLVIGDGGLQRRDDALAALANGRRPTRSASRTIRTPAPTAARAAPSAAAPPPPPVAPPLRRPNTSSSRIRPPTEQRAPREPVGGGPPQQRPTARPSRRSDLA